MLHLTYFNVKYILTDRLSYVSYE